MNAITVNSFPSIHSLTSPRGWALALIVLLHLGFFWALSNGLSLQVVLPKPKSTQLVITSPAKPQPVKPKTVDVGRLEPAYVPVPAIPQPTVVDASSDTSIEQITEELPPTTDERAPPAPVVMEPEIDERVGLSQPLYPPSSIRMGQTGTVLLSVEVLEDGRVGQVRIDQSSGYRLLDQSATREARRWRLKPGMRDGVPVVMWKQIPVTFRLNDAVNF